jgi:MATE family multidrug resistance protein
MLKEINKSVLKIAGPSILANITVPLVGMVDLAISGRLGDAAMIGGIAIGTMFFDLLYWNFGFLRVGTAGITAQAYGRGDLRDSVRTLEQALSTSFISALLIISIQYLFLDAAFLIVDASPKVSSIAREYFLIRVWAAPATLTLFAFKGWFLGMQDAKSPMAADITVNAVNALLSYLLAIVFKMGISGIALGTVISQYSGLILSVSVFFIKYKNLFGYFHLRDSLQLDKLKVFLRHGGNLMLRSISFLLIYSGYTALSAKYGDTLLAVGTIVMKLMLLYSYFIDGFAYAGEALSGRFIGEKNGRSLRETVKILFYWSAGIGLVSSIIYMAAGDFLFKIMTNNSIVLNASREFLPWLIIMPIVSCIGFMWDGIYIGATATVSLRNTMFLSAVAFFAVYYITVPFTGFHALMAGYFAHLIVRTFLMTLNAKKEIYGRCPELIS